MDTIKHLQRLHFERMTLDTATADANAYKYDGPYAVRVHFPLAVDIAYNSENDEEDTSWGDDVSSDEPAAEHADPQAELSPEEASISDDPAQYTYTAALLYACEQDYACDVDTSFGRAGIHINYFLRGVFGPGVRVGGPGEAVTWPATADAFVHHVSVLDFWLPSVRRSFAAGACAWPPAVTLYGAVERARATLPDLAALYPWGALAFPSAPAKGPRDTLWHRLQLRGTLPLP